MADDIRLVIGVDDRDLIRTQKEQKKFERNLLIIEAAFRKGDITAARYTAELNKQAKGLSRLGGTYKKANSEVRTYSSVVRKLTDDKLRLTMAQNQAGKSTNRFGMYAQQVGYQVGDFFVQVQSGTSALVAFGQQGTQLAGLLPGVAGAVVGISLSVGTMLLRSFMDASGASKTFKESLEDTESAMEAYADYAEELAKGTKELTESFGSFSGAVKAVLEDLKDLEGQEALKNFNQQIENLSISTQSWRGIFAEALTGTSEAVNLLSKDLGLTVSQFVALNEESQNTKSGAIEDRVAAAVALRDSILEATGGTENMTKRMKDYYTNLLMSVKAGAELTATLDGSGKSSERLNEARVAGIKLFYEYQQRDLQIVKDRDAAVKKILDSQKKSEESFDKQLYAQSQSLTLLELENQYTKNSVEYKAELLAQETERLQTLIDQSIITEQQAKDSLELFKNASDVTDKIAEGAENANSLADALNRAAGAMSALSNFGDGIEKALSVAVAQTKAMVAGANAANAGRVAGMRFDAQAKYDKAVTMSGLTGESSIRVAAQQEFESQTSNINSLEGQLGTQSGIKESRKTKKSGGSGDKINAFEKLTVEIARRKELLKMSEAQATVTKGIWKLEDALGKDRAKYSAAELKAIVQKGIALAETELAAEEAIAQQQALADTLESSMSDAFTSMVDGTKSFKDAMKDMARAVIKQLFEILVVQRLVGSFDAKSKTGSGLVGAVMGAFQADGGAWQGGSQVQAYANGGVVNGPTTFGMSGGKTGLMGEAGPEAIMPLKRGSNGKLGVQMEGGRGGDTIVVHQNFNFQSNGDDSIKKLIAQAAPQISAMTKSSLLNDRRRGGATKAAFG